MNGYLLILFLMFLIGCMSEQIDQTIIGEKVVEDNVIEENVDAIVVKDGDREDGDADVEYVKAVQNSDGTWTFTVTVKHADTGWDDYADGWDVVADGLVVKKESDIFTRPLAHPHVDEQPFTRSQSGLIIAQDEVIVRAHDSVDGYGGREVIVDLHKEKGEHFEVERKLS